MAETSVSPYLTVKGAKDAIAFYQDVFEAEVTGTMDAEDGKRLMHASLIINGGLVMLSDEFPEFGGHQAPDPARESPVAIGLALSAPSEVDRIHDLCIEKGGKSSHAPEDMFWGDRFAQVICPWGHRWMMTAALPGSQNSES